MLLKLQELIQNNFIFENPGFIFLNSKMNRIKKI